MSLLRQYLPVLLFLLLIQDANAQLFSKAAKDIRKAEELIAKKQYEEALTVLNTALDNAKGKEDYEVYYLKGFCDLQLGRHAVAIEQFNFALAKVNSKQVLAPKPEEYVLNSLLARAQAYEATADYASAIKDLQLLSTYKGKPSLRSLAYEKWSRDLYDADRIANQDQAELIIAKAVEVDPKNASALSYQAELAMNERGYDEAVPLLEKAIDIESDVFQKARYQSLLALCQYRLGKKDEALKIFKSAVDTAPESTKWKIYQQHANLVILHHLYDPTLLGHAKLWANRAAILSEDCSNNITFAYMLALNNELTAAKELIGTTSSCQNTLLRMSKDSLSGWLDALQRSAKQNIKLRGYGNNGWYYMGPVKGGMAEGKGKAISKNFLYELKDAQFVRNELVTGTLVNLSEGWRYTGSFKAESITGNGTIVYPDGDQYTGRFAQNQPNGKGKWKYADGSIYEGDVLNGVPQGNGKYLAKQGNAYEGQFKNGKPNGKGFITVGGTREPAEFTDGQRTDAVYLARVEQERRQAEAEQKAAQALAMKRLKEEELARAEKRKKTGKILGKTLALAGGAIALKHASSLGLSDGDVTELGVALVSDVLTDGKSNMLASTLQAKSAGLSNPMTPAGAAGAGGAAGAASNKDKECDCMKQESLKKYTSYKGPDGQLNALCGQRACFQWILNCKYGGNNPQLQGQISQIEAVIRSMRSDGQMSCSY